MGIDKITITCDHFRGVMGRACESCIDEIRTKVEFARRIVDDILDAIDDDLYEYIDRHIWKSDREAE